MTGFLTDFTIQAPENVIIPQGSVEFNVQPSALNPKGSVSLRVPLIGVLEGPYRVYQMLSTYALSQFRFNFTSTVLLSTFLGGAQGFYDCTAVIGSGSCFQVAVAFGTPHVNSHPGGT
jgi:hypothetical protein